MDSAATSIEFLLSGALMEPQNAGAGESALSCLTRRMAAGEEEAFAEFHAAYFPRLFRYILVLLRGDEHAARDVTQEAFLRVVRNVKTFEDPAKFWDWLALLSRSAAADHGRRGSRYRRLLQAFLRQPVQEYHPPAETDLEEALARGLESLAPAEADLLTRKYYQNASVKQLAAAFAVTEETIESRLVRARQALRKTVFSFLKNEKS